MTGSLYRLTPLTHFTPCPQIISRVAGKMLRTRVEKLLKLYNKWQKQHQDQIYKRSFCRFKWWDLFQNSWNQPGKLAAKDRKGRPLKADIQLTNHQTLSILFVFVGPTVRDHKGIAASWTTTANYKTINVFNFQKFFLKLTKLFNFHRSSTQFIWTGTLSMLQTIEKL